MKERYVRVRGGRLFVREVGEGRPLLLLNGIGAHVEMWESLERHLDGIRCISFDAPSTGRTPVWVRPLGIPGLARLAAHLLDAVGVSQADVLGYSFGGAVGQQLAAAAPQRVRRLVLAATSPGWGGVPGRLSAVLSAATPLRYHSRRFYDWTSPYLAGGPTQVNEATADLMWSQRRLHAPNPIGYLQQLVAISSYSSLRRLGAVTAPTLVLAGDDDRLIPASNASIIASRIAGARLVIVPGEGHFMLLERRASASEDIARFLKATNLDDDPTWLSARVVRPGDVRKQIAESGRGPFPWGAASTLIRGLVR